MIRQGSWRHGTLLPCRAKIFEKPVIDDTGLTYKAKGISFTTLLL